MTDLSLAKWAELRRSTIEVNVGGIPLGGNNPIRVQTMTTTNTNNTNETAAQCIRALQVGAEYLRITTQGVREAENLAQIKAEIARQGYSLPLVADVHFNPAAAFEAAQHVEKVRINPGNFIDPRAKFQDVSYSDSEYSDELQRIEDKLLPLIAICKQRGVAIRVGVNHGSLSDRIMSRYGDSPEGMVESAMEFLRIFRKHEFNQLVISMKSSNTHVMVQAVRLLVHCMNAENMYYPLHLGVTEAGDGDDGRIKSALGIGALLADGLGDTIRVSLTEEPESEIPVARKLVDYLACRPHYPSPVGKELPYNPYSYSRRDTYQIQGIGSNNVPAVFADLRGSNELSTEKTEALGWKFDTLLNKYIGCSQFVTDYILVDDLGKFQIEKQRGLPLIVSIGADALLKSNSTQNCFVNIYRTDLSNSVLVERLKNSRNVVIILNAEGINGYAEQRAAFVQLMQLGIKSPVIIARSYTDTDSETFQIKAAADLGGLLIDGLGDGIMLTAKSLTHSLVCSTGFSILQAARTRLSKTEYIACPGCGRTLYNLQQTLQRVKEVTAHLKGLKIGVMGCIVNGPGEMADADYGYVGAAAGKISLYKGKNLIKKNIPESDAIAELVAIIKENGDWHEK